MTRSIDKGPFVADHLLRKIENLNLKREKNNNYHGPGPQLLYLQ